ncbi:MAG: sulfatase-like hydrolase/transferase [Bryobacteraceae bacterium]|nr:sulfatase-like hydrolase/transferase [Bryobacteraceae bacterium]MDW8379463.1 sulfatase-like hydrolase/transferase [Bryobacterales bacterium]
MLTRRDWLAASASSLSPLTGTQKQTPRRRAKQPNFLFLIADDHAAYVMGADGDRQAVTPHLDQLAAQGARFAAHYCNSPVCTPSRQSFFTGQMPSTVGVTRLPTPLNPDKPTLAKQFKQAGYRTAVIGKMHFNRRASPGLHGFDYLITERELAADWNKNVRPRPIPQEIRTKPAWRPFRDPARIWLNADKLPYPRYEQDMKAAYQVRLAEQFLEENRQTPFALWVSFHEPHSPFDFPVELRSKFDPKTFHPPRVGPEDGWQIPKIFRDLTEEDKQGILAAYYTSVFYLDQNLGRLLEKLRRLNLEENTLVVYTADHGYDLGHHGRFEKHCGWDPALRVPVIWRYPGKIRPGVIHDLTEHLDLAPTVVDLLDLEPLPIQHGRSLRPYFENRKIQPRPYIFSQYLENEEAYVRTHRWKLIYGSGKRARGDGYETDHPTPGRYVRLYDLQADPDEFTNVAERFPGLVAELEQILLDRFRSTHPEADQEPPNSDREAILDWYLRPRDV